jgi:hypothetical protein
MIRQWEPRMEDMLHRFLRSERGRDLLADLGAEMTADLLISGPGANDLVELLVERLALRLAKDRPDFRRSLLKSLHGLGPLLPVNDQADADPVSGQPAPPSGSAPRQG